MTAPSDTPPPGAAPVPAPRGFLASLDIAPFRHLFRNTFLAWFGSGFLMITSQDYLIRTLRAAGQDSGIVQAVGLVAFFGLLPLFLFSVFAGAVADRVDRRRLLIVSQAGRLALGVLLLGLYLQDELTVRRLYALNFAMGTMQAFVQPTRLALVPALVPPAYLLNAVALTNLAQHASLILAPVVAGLLIAYVGMGASFTALTLLFALAIVPLLSLRVPARAGGLAPGAPGAASLGAIFSEIAAGLRDAWNNRVLRGLIFTTALPGLFFIGPFSALVPLLARDVYGSDVRGQGLIQGVMGVGLIVGGVTVGRRHDLTGLGRKMAAALALGGTMWILVGTVPILGLGVPLLFVFGVSGGVFFNMNLTLTQREVSEAMRGRIMSIVTLATQGCAPIGNLAATWLAAAIGARTTVALGVQHTLQLAGLSLVVCIASLVVMRARVLDLD